MQSRSRVWLTAVLAVVFFTPISAHATHLILPALWDFETAVDQFQWSSTTRMAYSYTETETSDLVSSNFLIVLPPPLLELSLMDVFIEPTRYSFSFDLVVLGASPPTGFSVNSHGSSGDLSDAVQIGSIAGGGAVYHFESLVSTGPAGGCCGDVAVQWSLTSPSLWGIDNFVLAPVPEPTSAALLGLGLAALVRSRKTL